MEKQLNREMLEALVESQEKIDKLEFIEMLEFLVGQIIKTLKERIRCSIFRVFPESEMLCLLAGDSKGEHGIGMKFNFSDLTALREVVETKSWSMIVDPRQDPKTEKTHDLFYSKEVNALLLIPLLVKDEVLGIIAIDATGERKRFSEEEIYFCLTLSNLASLLIERDLTQKEKMEKESLVTIGRVAGEAVHKLKNPIQYIHGFAKRLLKEVEDSPLVPWTVKDYAERIFSGALNLEETFNGLVRFSRPKRAKLEKVDINETIRNLSAGLIKDKKDFKLGFNLDPNLPSITADPSDIEGIIFPILRNAVEAIKKDGEIRVKSGCNKEHIRISISNNGGCISDEIIGEIFDPFFTTKPDGTGLGLATATSIIRAYNGTIKVENDKSLNLTTFTVQLPTNLTAERG